MNQTRYDIRLARQFVFILYKEIRENSIGLQASNFYLHIDHILHKYCKINPL